MRLRHSLFLSLFWRPFVSADDADDADDADLDSMETTEETAEAVIALTDGTFDAFVKTTPKFLVEFYAPWCGHCKQLAPVYEEAAKELASKKMITKLTKVDATVETKINGEHNVQGYPTLFYYADGVRSEYNGPRDKDGIVKWVTAREKDPVEVCSEEKLKEAQDDVKTHFIIVAKVIKKSGKATALKKAMTRLSTEERASNIFACYEYLEKGSDEKKLASLTMERKLAFETADKEFKFSGTWNQPKLVSWIVETIYNPVAGSDEKWGANVDTMGAKGIFVIAAPNKKPFEDAEKTKYAGLLKKLSKKNKNMRFALWDDKDWDRTTIIGDVAKPVVAIVAAPGTDGGQQIKKYVDPTDEITEKSMEQWLKTYLSGKLKPTHKSQPEPAETLDNGVTVLVGSTFERVAYNSKKDVFVEFYAPWCGHCKKLTPEWEATAKRIKELGLSDKVVIAKMDATENESEVEINGFPKLVLFPATKNSFKNKKEFQGGERVQKKFLEFLSEAAVNLEGVDIDTESDGGKFDKKKFSMIDRELAKKKKKTEL